jgi:hypothetical protein
VRRYRAFGLRIAARIELPELTPDPDTDAPVDVEIAPGDAGEAPRDARRVAGAFAVAADDCLIEIDGIARYRVRGGSKIIVEAVPGMAPRRVRLDLLGSALGVICYQRGILPLHASVVEIAGRSVAFMGPSGAGKSTIAAALQARGARLLGDDICAIHLPPGDRAFVWPGIPRVKLWEDSALALGYGERSARLPPTQKLQFLASAAAAIGEAGELAGLYLLVPRGECTDPEPVRLTSADAFNTLLANSFRPSVMAAMGLGAANLAQCSDLLRRCAVFGMERSPDLAGLDRTAQRLEAHLGLIGMRADQIASGK